VDLWGVEARRVARILVEMKMLILVDVHRLAAFFTKEGIKKGDAVAVFTTNSPEMLIIYLALSKLSAICGFININLRGQLLSLGS
jgi:acyl-coenzyme A synthetase/AMP-(fatty) acid ligase